MQTQTWAVVLLSTHHCWIHHLTAAPNLYTTAPVDVLQTFSFSYTCDLGVVVAKQVEGHL